MIFQQSSNSIVKKMESLKGIGLQNNEKLSLFFFQKSSFFTCPRWSGNSLPHSPLQSIRLKHQGLEV